MDDGVKKIEMLDQFIANEKKSKRFTIISISVLCLLGILVFFFAFKLVETTKKYNRELETKNASLYSLRDSLAQVNLSLERNSYNYDSLKNAFDTLAFLFNNNNPGITGNNLSQNSLILDELSKVTFKNKDVILSDTLKKSILTTHNPEKKVSRVYRIYIQSMPDYIKIAFGVAKILKKNEYAVPDIETIENITFDPVVKYFHDEDQEEAKKIAALINNSNSGFKNNPVKIQRLNIKSPVNQIEVWIGKFVQRDLKMLMQQNAPNDFKKQ